ncbi:MAG TPA: hypothetical protein VH418_06975 [Solirubrobacteraceae bacterium]|jgi:hypothetical protein
MQARARLRTASTLAACAYAVHSLRYLLAYGSHAQGELQRQGHAYLAAAPVLLTALLALGAGELLRAAARGERAASESPPLVRAWASAGAALLAIFCVQELLEGMLAAGHPAGLQAVAAGGGWLAVPLSGAFGLLAAVLGRGARAVLERGAPLLLALPQPEPRRLSRPAPRPVARRGALRLGRGRAPPAMT